MERECTLTTIDNPFDPFDQFESWLSFDIEKGYYTNNILGRLVQLSDDMSQVEINNEIERAIDEFIAIEPLNIFKKAVRNEKEIKNKTDASI